MIEYKMVELGDFSFITKLAGFEHTKYIQPNASKRKINDDDVPMFIGKNIKNGQLTKDIHWYIPKVVSSNLERSALVKKCIVLPYVGSLGDVAIFDSKFRHHLASNVAKVELSDDAPFSIEYLYYYLKSPFGQKQLLFYKQGGIQKNITMEAIRKTMVTIPENEKTIVKVLSDLDAKIEVNNKINQELEALAKTIYDYWFVQFDFPSVTSSGVERPYKSSGGKMVYSEQLKREIPEGWEDSTISDWIENGKNGDWGREAEEGNYTEKVSCIRGADINGLNGNGEVKSPTRYILEKNSHKILEKGDLIVEISGGSPTQSTGRLAFITKETLDRFENPLICSNFCKAVTLKNKTYLYNFVYNWNRLYDAGVLFGWEGKTSGIKNLLFENFITNYKVVKPPIAIVEQFHNKVKVLHQKKQKNLLENQKLAALRDWLLPMLMNGQVRVAQPDVKKNLGEAKEKLRMVAEDNSKYGEV